MKNISQKIKILHIKFLNFRLRQAYNDRAFYFDDYVNIRNIRDWKDWNKNFLVVQKEIKRILIKMRRVYFRYNGRTRTWIKNYEKKESKENAK